MPQATDGPEPREPDSPDAFELAVGALSRKERTTAELSEWLRNRGVDEAEAAAAIERLLAIGELDDQRFAERYAEDKRELRGWGPERIAAALVERGIERAMAEHASGGEDPAALAERGARLLLGRGTDLSTETGRGRALAYLARRGYGSEAAYGAVRRAERRQAEPDRRAA